MVFVVILLAFLVPACTNGGSPTTPTVVVTPTPSQTTTPTTVVPPAVGAVLSIAMPIDLPDIASAAFGLLPFGYHGADHAGDGHSGWDIEYRQGALVRAAAAGVVQAIEPDTIVAGRTVVRIEHLIGDHIYRTVYANLSSAGTDIVLNATVRQGQAIGASAAIARRSGDSPE